MPLGAFAQAQDHSQHQAPEPRAGHQEPARSPGQPAPALTDADRAAAFPPADGHPTHENAVHGLVRVDQLEGWQADQGAGLQWELEGWLGTDLDRVWLRSDGERSDGHIEAASLELLYGHSFAAWWDVVAGVRQDFRPGGRQSFAVIGIQGLAPQRFEIEASVYLGSNSRSAARLSAGYELLVTNRLVLQPVLEIELYGKSDPSRGTGSGLATVESGLRLRYEITRRFAPYLGVTYERGFGRTAELRRNEGEEAGEARFVAGVRLWF
jgi:copper resistance protein B